MTTNNFLYVNVSENITYKQLTEFASWFMYDILLTVRGGRKE